jgi:hypothetical protein
MNTAQDVVDYLLAATGGGAQDGEHQAVRLAVVNGVRDVMQCKQWLWHTKTNSFVSANVTATVISNGITEGSRTVALSSAAQMVVGRLVACGDFFDEPCRIVSIQGNVITVDKTAKRNIQAGELPLTLTMQTFYDLPADLKDIDTLVTHTVGTLHCYLSPQEWQRLEVNTRGTGEPYYYTIMRSDVNPDRYQIRFVGIPANGTTVHYTYRYIPRAIAFMGYEQACRRGTVSASGTTVTGDGTGFRAAMEGCIIRFGTTTTEPEPVGSLTPYRVERTVVDVTSITSMKVDVVTGLPALTKYSISDPLDASPQMYTAILSAAEMWYARIAGKPYDAAMQTYVRDLRMAMENDVVAPLSGRPPGGHYPTPRSMGWHSQLQQDLQ